MTSSAPSPSSPPVLEQKRLVTVPLLSRETIGENYHVLTFEDPGGPRVAPGQFAMVRGAEWGDAPLLPRPMSYVTGGDRPSILIKTVGEGTRRMGRSEPGEPFVLLGPLGRPWRPHTPGRRQLLVGGGVGIAPLLFFARQLAALDIKPVCIYGGRTERDLPLNDELELVASLQITTEDGSRGTRGRVTDILKGLLAEDTEVYTCGPNAMMASVAALCASAGVPCEASLETPMACGYGVCLGCPVPTVENRYLYACMEGPCIDAPRIDWNALLKKTALAGGVKS